MSKERLQKLTYKGEYGKIIVSGNDESEFKIGFFFKNELQAEWNKACVYDETRIASIGLEVWNAYLQHRYSYEAMQEASLEPLVLADRSTIPSFHQEQKRESRLRSFFIMAHNHPADLEIRVELRDGKKIIMLKKGNGASQENPIIRRHELKLVCDVHESTEHALLALPDIYQEEMGFRFNKHNRLYEPMQSHSMRAKTKVRLRHDAFRGSLVFAIEPAYDMGSGLVVTDVRWPIREFEGEVKGIYRINGKIDIKANPESLGLSHEEIGALCAEVLQKERDDYLEFAQLHLLCKARDNPARYGDIEVAGIYDSKSTPGRKILNAELARGQSLEKLMRCLRTGEIRTLDLR